MKTEKRLLECEEYASVQYQYHTDTVLICHRHSTCRKSVVGGEEKFQQWKWEFQHVAIFVQYLKREEHTQRRGHAGKRNSKFG